jgi:hypothetical protein
MGIACFNRHPGLDPGSSFYEVTCKTQIKDERKADHAVPGAQIVERQSLVIN